ncbi:MAG: hypothetical protein EOP86_28145 [Verrucomicrobiaceae bacterium]|nr:MAG: hypothetical protein EOP86_28145 [Verrucomicrobiaceae bacterium]
MKNSHYLKTVAGAAWATLLCSQVLADVNFVQPGPLKQDWSTWDTRLSSDGSVAAGTYGPSNGAIPGMQGYRWDASTGMQEVSLPKNMADSSQAIGISGDGNVVVGYSWKSSGAGSGMTAFRWTVAGGAVSLGDFAGGQTLSVANAVSWDGGVIAGSGTTDQGQRAFKWTQATGMTSLPLLTGGNHSTANAVSYDGGTIVGSIRTWDGVSSATNAVIWDSTGIVTLGDFHGNDIMLTEATAVRRSAGRRIQAWWAWAICRAAVSHPVRWAFPGMAASWLATRPAVRARRRLCGMNRTV